MGEVVIENLKIGQSYSLTQLAHVPLAITNSQAHPVRVCVTPLIPGASELRLGAEAIPELRWAAASPETLALAAGQTGTAELRLTIPDDPRLFGRRFQVVFWSHTLPLPGEQIAFGLKSRIIFSIDREREHPGAAPQGDLSLTLLPAELRLAPLTSGRSAKLENAEGHPLTIRNTSDHPASVTLEVLSAAAAGLVLGEGRGELLRAAKVTFAPAMFTLAAGEERTLDGTVLLGPGRRVAGDELIGVVSASITSMAVTTRIFARLSTHVR